MKELICVNPKNYNLTLNSKYLVVADEGNTVMLINDGNKTARYYKDLFEEVEEVVIPEPEPVVVRTEQDLIDSIANDGVSTTYIDFDNQLITITNDLGILNNANDFSCGVKNVINIKDQISRIYDKIVETEETSEEDLPLLTKALIESHIKSYIQYKADNGYNAGIYLISCNITGGGLEEEDVEILNEIADFNTEPELNPNNNNEIVIWGFYKSNLDN